ncbi:MAG: hypothetical protein IPH35_25610 [Rhodoferax sp.]|nr:hypothetical protein [Rhodoferax sp.]
MSGGSHEIVRLPALDGKLVRQNQQKKTAHLGVDSAKNHTSVDFRVDV